jgi:hypothetical protein
MACPSCGGNSRLLIAPGFYHCTSRIVTRSGGPGLTDLSLGPPVIETVSECGAEYQDGVPATAAACACGTFAIGRCAECSQPVCGTHSGIWGGGKRLCRDCRARASAAQAARKAEEDAEAERQLQEQRQAWRQRVLADLAGSEPIERLVRVVGRFSVPSAYTGYHGDQATTDVVAVDDLLGSHKWTLAQVAEWFCRRASGSPPHEITVVQKTKLGREKSARVAAWTFDNGATTTHQWYGDTNYDNIAIAKDGRIFVSGSSRARFPLVPPHPGWVGKNVNLSYFGLLLVFKASGLQAVEAPPAGPRKKYNQYYGPAQSS